jgi:hypothetical protein
MVRLEKWLTAAALFAALAMAGAFYGAPANHVSLWMLKCLTGSDG